MEPHQREVEAGSVQDHSGDGRLKILLLDYQMAREDDRAAGQILTTMISVAIALLAGIVAVFTSSNYGRLPDAVIAGAPLLPMAIISYVLIVSTTAIVRSFYMRALESELRDFGVKDLTKLPGVRSPSGVELIVGMASGSRGRPIYRLVYAIILLAVLLVFGGVTILLARDVELAYKIAMLLIYGPLGLLLFVEGIYINTSGRSLFRSILRMFRADSYQSVSGLAEAGRPAPPRERSLTSYLVFPRPEDITKWLFVPAAGLIGYLLPVNVSGRSSENLLYAVLAGWLCLEYLTYQARYQINDIRGLSDDLCHPAASERKRLPVYHNGVGMSILASLVVAAIRVAGVVVVILASPFGTGATVGWASLAVVLSTIAYEFLRTFWLESVAGARVNAMLIWVLVGSGYCIRVCAGLALVGLSVSNYWYAYLLFGVAAWAFGVMFVTFTWVLEAMGHLYRYSSSVYGYEVTGNNSSLGDKLHLKELLPYIGIRPIVLRGPIESFSCRDLRPLAKGRGHVLAPWNVSFVIASCFGALSCIAGAVRPGDIDVRDVVLVIGVTAGSFLLLLARSTSARLAAFLVTLSVAGLIAISFSLQFAAAVLVVTAIFGAMYIFFRASSYGKLKSLNQDMAEGVAALAAMSARAVLGPRTFNLVSRGRSTRARDGSKHEDSDYQKFSP